MFFGVCVCACACCVVLGGYVCVWGVFSSLAELEQLTGEKVGAGVRLRVLCVRWCVGWAGLLVDAFLWRWGGWGGGDGCGEVGGLVGRG